MKNKKIIGLISVCLFFTFMIGCNLSATEQGDKKEFSYEARLVTEKGSEFYENAGLEVYFANKSPKAVVKFQVTYYLFDEEGEYFGNATMEVRGKVPSNEYCHVFLSLDEDFENKNPEKCFVDNIYINKIIYEDGSEFDDPYGLKYFLNQEFE